MPGHDVDVNSPAACAARLLVHGPHAGLDRSLSGHTLGAVHNALTAAVKPGGVVSRALPLSAEQKVALVDAVLASTVRKGANADADNSQPNAAAPTLAALQAAVTVVGATRRPCRLLSDADEARLRYFCALFPMPASQLSAVASRLFPPHTGAAMPGALFSEGWITRFLDRHHMTRTQMRGAVDDTSHDKLDTRVAAVGQLWVDAATAMRVLQARIDAGRVARRHALRALPLSHVFQIDEVSVWVGVPGTQSGRVRIKYCVPVGSTGAHFNRRAHSQKGVTRLTGTVLLISNADVSFVGAWLILPATGKHQTWPKLYRGDYQTSPVQVRFSRNSAPERACGRLGLRTV